jgi:hypothetical protein
VKKLLFLLLFVSNLTYAQTMPAEGGILTGDTSGGTSQQASTNCADLATSISPEAVITWTAPRSGLTYAETCGIETAFDTVLYIRDNTDSEVVCNDDSCLTLQDSFRASQVSWNAVAGMTYTIIVDGYNGAPTADRGTWKLTLTPPPGYVPPTGPRPYTSTQWEWDAVTGTGGQGVATGYRIYYSMLNCCNPGTPDCEWSTHNMVDILADIDHCGTLHCSSANSCCGDFLSEPPGDVLFFTITAYNEFGESSTEHGPISSVPCP